MKIDRKALVRYLKRINATEHEIERLFSCDLSRDVSRETKAMIWQFIQHQSVRQAIRDVAAAFPKARVEAIR